MTERKYQLPNKTLPYLTNATRLEDLNEFISIADSLGIKISGTRIIRYLNYYEALVEGTHDEEKYFQGISGKNFNSPLDLELYVLREVDEIRWIAKGLKKHIPKGIEKKLKVIVGGRDFAALDKDSFSRNTQFELRIASYFCQAGYSVDLSNLTDIIAYHNGITYFVECKRVTSFDALIKRIKEAQKQLKMRLTESALEPRKYGVIAIDVTAVAFKCNGLTMGLTPEHSKDVIQDKLKEIDEGIIKNGLSLNKRKLVLTWLQIHMPAYILYPSHAVTRFSSYFIPNSDLYGYSIGAVHKLHNEVLTIGNIKDDREIPSRNLKIRESIILPEGTIIGWDEMILKEMLNSWSLEPRKPDHHVLTIVINGEKTMFSFFELNLLLAQLKDEDKERYANDIHLARAEIAARLVYQRSPYEDE